MQRFFTIMLLSGLLSSCQQQSVAMSELTPIQMDKIEPVLRLALSLEDVAILRQAKPQILKKIERCVWVNLDDIITMQQLGFTSDTMISVILHTETRFRLTTADVIRLQAEGVSFKVINFMIRT